MKDKVERPRDTATFRYSDGGRVAAGFEGDEAKDCACRSAAIATGKPYREVYDAIAVILKRQLASRRIKRRNTTPCGGAYTWTTDAYMKSIGWEWVPTKRGSTVYLRPSEMPAGRLVVRLSQHNTAVIDGVVHDTFDCGLSGRRRVEGYYRKPEPVSTTTKPKKPRSADRHREPNRDRHSPGYMREYMRRRRAARG